MSTETMNFSADVSRLLDIVANALYTHQDVFLRELISNAADACDRLRYESIQKPDLVKDNPDFRIHVYKDIDTRSLNVIDNGIGMNRNELIENLGTIAKSGTAAMMEQVKQSKTPDSLKLIGQFGVGFYAAYMVANTVKVISRKAGEKDIWVWTSDGRTGFEVRAATNEESAMLDGARGTAIILDIKDTAVEFLIDEQIRLTVERYSDHIDVPVYLGKPAEIKSDDKPMNKASALWMKSRNEVTKEEYTEFYKHITHGFDEPLLTSHWRAEGKIEYNALLFIPTLRPWDLYDPSRKNAVRLYVRRVFISDQLDGLVYPWMRFLRGVIDSGDLPLNISRESLQYNPVIQKIRTGVTRRILADLDKLSREDEPGFIVFWGQFGPALKEGLYDAAEHREEIFKICRFFSTHDAAEKFVSLEQYVARMKDGQDEIYYISGENREALQNSPQLEGFKARGLEVLLMTDTIDDFWLQQVGDYQGKKFKSITKGDIELKEIAGDGNQDAKPLEAAPDRLILKLKEVLEDEVQDVRISKRLTDSPVCLIAPEGGIDMHMERVLKIHQKYQGNTKPVLEINPGHSLIKKLEAMAENDNPALTDAARLLYDQARIIQGEPVSDSAGFVKRMSAFMEKGL